MKERALPRPMSHTAFILVGLALVTIPFAATAAVPILTPAVVINEVLYNPEGADLGAEAVELYNPTLAAVNLTGWSLADDDACRIGNVTLPDYRHALSGEIAPLSAFVVTLPSVGSVPKCLSLANTADVVLLRDATGTETDRVAWPGTAPGRVVEGLSVQRCFLEDSARWRAAEPTLGRANGPCMP